MISAKTETAIEDYFLFVLERVDVYRHCFDRTGIAFVCSLVCDIGSSAIEIFPVLPGILNISSIVNRAETSVVFRVLRKIEVRMKALIKLPVVFAKKCRLGIDSDVFVLFVAVLL